ncbi:hypothetical protein [Parafrankia sp. FMc2]|uniref:hypothetical protein n=1 Tax=Parafrankia sp. FMc2 TaxID=3233196 RepID=UPI0034D5D4A7
MAWNADPAAGFSRRLGLSAAELNATDATPRCPEIWELDNGDVAVVGHDLTADYRHRLPAGVHVGANERLVVIPRAMLISAKPDIPDA